MEGELNVCGTEKVQKDRRVRGLILHLNSRIAKHELIVSSVLNCDALWVNHLAFILPFACNKAGAWTVDFATGKHRYRDTNTYWRANLWNIDNHLYRECVSSNNARNLD